MTAPLRCREKGAEESTPEWPSTLPRATEREGILERLHPPNRSERSRIERSRRGASYAVSEKYFSILPDSPLTYSNWRRLVVAHSVLGVKVHDAWLAATMKAHGVAEILTFNGADFARYDGIDSVEPRSV